jgi:hypothetical protein
MPRSGVQARRRRKKIFYPANIGKIWGATWNPLIGPCVTSRLACIVQSSYSQHPVNTMSPSYIPVTCLVNFHVSIHTSQSPCHVNIHTAQSPYHVSINTTTYHPYYHMSACHWATSCMDCHMSSIHCHMSIPY